MRRTVEHFSPVALQTQRLRAGRTLADLADLAGVSAATLSGWERGAVVPTVPSLAAVAAALEITVTDLLDAPPRRSSRLIDLRVERGLTVQQLADAAGLSRQTVAKAENGQGALSAATADALGACLDLQPAAVRKAFDHAHRERLDRLRGTS